MNAQEIAAVLGMFQAAYPNAVITEQTAFIWARELVGVDRRDGEEAARTLVRTLKFPPSLAEFIEAEQSACRVRTGNQEGIAPAKGELEPAEHFTNAEREANVAKLVARSKALVAAQRNAKHWHGGPDPCPTCGGLP